MSWVCFPFLHKVDSKPHKPDFSYFLYFFLINQYLQKSSDQSELQQIRMCRSPRKSRDHLHRPLHTFIDVLIIVEEKLFSRCSALRKWCNMWRLSRWEEALRISPMLKSLLVSCSWRMLDCIMELTWIHAADAIFLTKRMFLGELSLIQNDNREVEGWPVILLRLLVSW